MMGVREAPLPLTLVLLRVAATLGMMGPIFGQSGGGADASLAPRTPTAGAYEAAWKGANDCGKSHDCSTCTKSSSGCSWCRKGKECVKCSGLTCIAATKFKCTAKEMTTAPSECPSDDDKVWRPPAPAPPITYCQYENLTCQHGTTMNASYCQRIKLIDWPACLDHIGPGGWDGKCNVSTFPGLCAKPGGCKDSYPSPGAPEFQDLGAVCQCKPHLNGTDCATVVAPVSMPLGKQDVCRQLDTHSGAHELKWDGSYLNPNILSPKHSECFFTPEGFPAPTNNHRVNVTIFPGAPPSRNDATADSDPEKLYEIELLVSMRRRSDHKTAETAALQELADACSATDMARNGVGNSAACLYPRHNEISCRLSQCAGVIEPDDQNVDKNGDPVLDVVYTCKSVHCETWDGLEEEVSALIRQINSQPNLQFKFKSFNQTLGTARAEFATQLITLAMECTTGQCVPSNQTAPPAKLPPRGPLSLWAVAAIIIVVVVCLIWFAVAIAVVKQRRPSTVGRATWRSSRGEGRGSGDATILEEELVSSVSSDSDDGFEGGTLAIATMAFANVKYTVKSAAGHGKQVLKGATGLIKPGELCAIMGPSGAGKSSLLDILAGQAKIGDTEGQAGCVLWNGSVLKASYARRHICRYVMQDDRAMATDTVEEALTFAANMTLPNSVPTGAIPRRVSKVLDQLRLNHVRSSRIGSSDAGGLSGGERRRLAVGVELIARPSVLLLDEPTSGLDSFSADIVIDVLKATAAEGTAVVVTIHQPSSQIFSLFDKLCLLAPGGVQVFFGTPAEALTLARIDRARRSTGSGHTPRPVPQMVATASTAAATSTSTVAGVRRERERELQAASDQTLQAPIGTGFSGGTVSLAVHRRVDVSKTQPDVAKKQGKTPRKPPRKSAGAGAATRPEPEPEPSQPKPSQVEAKQSPPVLGQSMEVRSSGGSGEENGDEVAVNLARGVPYLNPAEEVLKYSVDCAGCSSDEFAQAAWRITIDGAVQHVGLTPTTEAVSGSPSPYRRQPMSLVQDGGMASLGAEDSAISAKMSALGQLPGGFAQLELLCRRGFRNVWRNPNLMFLQLFVTLLVGGATGGLFYHLGMDLKGAENRMGVLFFVVLYFSIISMSSIGTIVSDKEIFLRDRAAGLYTVEPYFASKVICDLLPLRLLPPMLFSLIVYPLCSLHHGRMFIFIGTIVLLNATATAMCFFAAAVSKNAGTANLWASLLLIYNVVFGGLLLTARSTTVVVCMYAAPLYHAFETLMVNEFHGYSDVRFNPSHSSLGDKSVLVSGDTFLENMGHPIFEHPNLMLEDLTILGVACVIFWVVGYLSFRFQTYKR